MSTLRMLLLCALVPSLTFGQTVTCDRFDPKATPRGNQLTVSPDTDLPDSTNVMVSVSRSYYAGAPLQEHPLEYLGTRATVGDWRKPKVVSVDYGIWRKKLDERARVVAVAGEVLKVERIGTDLTVSSPCQSTSLIPGSVLATATLSERGSPPVAFGSCGPNSA